MSLNLAMLSDDIGAGQLEGGLAAGDPAQTAILETEVAVQDIEIAVDQGGDISATIDTAEGTADVVEAANDQLEDAAESGAEVPEQAMEAIRILLGGHMKNLGFESAGFARRADRALGMESFGPRMDKKRSLKLATEAVGEMLSSVWEAIKKALKAAWDWVRGYWNKFFGGAERMERAYVELIKGIENKKNLEIDSEKEWSARSYMEILPGINSNVAGSDGGATKKFTSATTISACLNAFVADAGALEKNVKSISSEAPKVKDMALKAMKAVEDIAAGVKPAAGDRAAGRKILNASFDLTLFATRVYVKAMADFSVMDVVKPNRDIVDAELMITAGSKTTVGSMFKAAEAGYAAVKAIVRRKTTAADTEKDLDAMIKELDRLGKAMGKAAAGKTDGKAEKKEVEKEAKDSITAMRSIVIKALPAAESAGLTGCGKALSLMGSALSSAKAED